MKDAKRWAKDAYCNFRCSVVFSCAVFLLAKHTKKTSFACLLASFAVFRRLMGNWMDPCKSAHTLTWINSYEYTRVSLYESKTAQMAWCKLHWHKFIRVNRVILVRVNHSPKHALANDFIRTNWHRVPQIIMRKLQNLSMFSRKQWRQQTKSWFRLLSIKKSL